VVRIKEVNQKLNARMPFWPFRRPAAQKVTEMLVEAGIHAILNFAPCSCASRSHVFVRMSPSSRSSPSSPIISPAKKPQSPIHRERTRRIRSPSLPASEAVIDPGFRFNGATSTRFIWTYPTGCASS